MTGTEAAKILERPIFGNQVCIDAIGVMCIAEDLLHARQWAKGRGISGPSKKSGVVALMEHEVIVEELNYWHECGYRGRA